MRLLALIAVGCAHRVHRTTLVESGLDRLDVAGPVGEWAPDPSRALVPVGRWVRVGETVAFTYFDPSEGLSASWRDEERASIRRLVWAPAGLEVLDDPSVPEWVEGYGPQPPPGSLYGAWRDDDALRGRLHPDYPDDLRVVVGTTEFYEVVWARIRSCDGLRCDAALLNQPDRVPGLTIGSSLWFDLAATAPDRPPVAAATGREPDAALAEVVATHDAFAAILQDAEPWTVDDTAPPASRLVPIGSWGWVGSDLVWFFVGEQGPVAAIVVAGSAGPQFQSLTWRPRGYRPVTDYERTELKLPETVTIEGAPEQPPPGPWGTWRVDEATSWLFRDAGDPDVVPVLVLEQEPGQLRVRGCDQLRCWGTLVEDAAGLAAGTAVDIVHLAPPDIDRERFVPVAEPVRK